MLYFFLAYLVVAGLCAATRHIIKRLPGDTFDAHRRQAARRVSLAVLLSLPLLPYVLVAVQTALFLPSLRPAIRQAAHDTGYIDPGVVPDRVLWMTPDTCHVAVRETVAGSSPRLQCEFVIILRRTPTGWRLHDCETIWSDVGSAEGNTFPPVWDADEF
ncbi:MAG: hypothetical protein H7Y38_11590 [Armatimonadetes bacterium]|nr:hypothetical protein [Armatimonadota bacterium]